MYLGASKNEGGLAKKKKEKKEKVYLCGGDNQVGNYVKNKKVEFYL